MWQVLLAAAAAAAGSGILAKKLINPTETQNPIFNLNQNDQHCVQINDAFEENTMQEKRDLFSNNGKIFRFSSPDSGWPNKELKKNARNGFKGFKKNGGSKRGNKNGAFEVGAKTEMVVDHRGNGSGRKISICLKKRKTGKHVAGKCESCATKDNSFGWGVGVGIMYMMSAGNAEISKLNCAMDETVKTVQQLKAEISKRKSSHYVGASIAENESEMNKSYLERSDNGPLYNKLDAESKGNLKTFGPVLIEEGECSSRDIFTQEQQPEVLEMDRLEAEFESELQKLNWCTTEGSGSEGKVDMFEAEVLVKGHQLEDFEYSNSYQYNGVLPAELDEKLRHLQIEQQENQIVELEFELHKAHSKLHEKEAELRALKDCVKRLTQFSLANASDEEIEEHEEDMITRRHEIEDNVRFESAESTVGMKRSMACDSYICSKN